MFKVGDRDVRKELLSETNRLLMGNDCKKNAVIGQASRIYTD